MYIDIQGALNSFSQTELEWFAILESKSKRKIL